MEWWNMVADMAKLTDSVRILTFQRYCAQHIKDEVRALDGYDDQDWKVFNDAILKEYKSQDAVDRYATLGHLESLASQTRRTNEEIRKYVRQYAIHAKKAIKLGRINQYMAVIHLLKGCGPVIARKTLGALSVTALDEETFQNNKFDAFVAQAVKQASGTDALDTIFPQDAHALPIQTAAQGYGEYVQPFPLIPPQPVYMQPPQYATQPSQPMYPPQPQQQWVNSERIRDTHMTGTSPAPLPTAPAPRKAMDYADLAGAMEHLSINHMRAENERRQRYTNEQQSRPIRGVDINAMCTVCTQPVRTHGDHWTQCPDIKAWVSAGLVHFNQRGVICGGPVGSGNPPIRAANGGTFGDSIRNTADGHRREQAGPTQTASVRFAAISRNSDVLRYATADGVQKSEASAMSTGFARNNGPHVLQRGEPMIMDPEPAKDRPQERQEPRRLAKELERLKGNANDIIFQAILDAPIALNVKTALAASNDIRKAFFQAINKGVSDDAPISMQVRVEDVEDEYDTDGSANSAAVHASRVLTRPDGTKVKFSDFFAACGYGEPQIGDAKVLCLIDEGSEANIIGWETALQCGLVIGPPLEVRIEGITGHVGDSGTALDVPVKFGMATTITDFLIVKKLPAGVLLGRPWSRAAKFSKRKGKIGPKDTPTEYWDCSVDDQKTGATCHFRARLAMASDLERVRNEADGPDSDEEDDKGRQLSHSNDLTRALN
jgi:hypothetical protein